MDTDSLIIHIITENFYEDIADDVERWFDTSNYDENDKRSLPTGKKKKLPGLFKDELGGKIIKELYALRPITQVYLIDGYDDDDYEKNKIINKKKVYNKMYENYRYCLFNGENILKSQQRFKSDHHEVNTEEVNKIGLSNNDNKRL